jgi:squalene-hopene/tetraprenyl-beta-curcumene cyclase
VLGDYDTSRVAEAQENAFRILDTRRRTGSWVGELSSSALCTSMSSVALYLRPEAAPRSAWESGLGWLAKTQHDDGGWGDAIVDPSNMNATSMASAVLHYCAAEEYGDRVRAGRRWVERAGGFSVLNDPRATSMSGPGRTMYALAGFYDWRRIRRLPTEVVLLPGRVQRTLSITFSSILSLSVLHDRFAPVSRWRRPLRRRAVREAVGWLRRAQAIDGSFGGSAMLASITVVCLTLADAGGEDIVEKALTFLLESQRPDGSWPMARDLENFDTTQAVYAHEEAGRSIPGGEKVRNWFFEHQWRTPCFHTSASPGGWAWEPPSGWPDVDDTACTVRSLRILGVGPEEGSLRSGLRWLYEMQNRDGSWPTFVRDSRVPFDRGCPYITSQVLTALAAVGPEGEAAQRALAYLRSIQRPDGAFHSLWFRPHTRGTAAVIEAFSDLGLGQDLVVRRAEEWLRIHQNPDGGWGDGRGAASTAEETSWATAALLRQEAPPNRMAVERGVGWLLDHQRSDGGWDPGVVGVYFSSVIYSNVLYAVSYPLIALSRYLRWKSSKREPFERKFVS